MGIKEFFYGTKSISKDRKKELDEFTKNIGLHFSDYEILDLALHHRSFSNESKTHARYNNERLEFLGDSVLGLATASFLYEDMENPEGDLAKIKANVVSEKALAPVALEKMHLDKYLILGKGEEMTGGRRKPAILADAVEAVIGALYLDCGYEAAKKFVLSFIVPEIRKVQNNTGTKDYKTILQEKSQKHFKTIPVYVLEKTSGPDHDKTFYISVKIDDKIFGPAKGSNKKNAQQEAAKIACEAMKWTN